MLELASILAGPITGQFLAELGAEVVKVENPATAGDPTRHWRLADEPADTAVSAYFSCANWGKRSIALDVSRPGGRGVVHALARQSDVVIASYKPGDDARLQLDPGTLMGLNERLVYAQISAYGRNDGRPGFDAVIQAESGFTFLNGEAGGGPVKMPVALVDLLAAHQLKEAILLALLRRERSSLGAHVHVSLLDAAVASLANQASNYLVAGVVPGRMGSEHPNIVPYGAIYHLSDKQALVLAVGTERQWLGLARTLGRDDLARDPRFADNAARVRHRRALHDALKVAFSALDAATAAERLGHAGVPFGFVNDMAAVFTRQRLDHLMLAGDVAGQGHLRGVRSFVASGLGPALGPAPPPAYNADGPEVLASIGYDAAGRAALVREGAWPGETPPAPS